MRIHVALTACSSVVGLCILGTLGACVGDEVATTPAGVGPDGGGGAETSSPGTDSGGGDSSSVADAGTDAGPPASIGTHKFAKSYTNLIYPSTIGVYGEDLYVAAQGLGAVDIDGHALSTTAGDVVVTKLDATGKGAWATKLAGAGGNANLRAGAVAANATGAYVSGVFDTSTLTIGPDVLTRTTTPRAGFVAKLDLDGTAKWGRLLQTTAANFSMICPGLAVTTAGIAVACTVEQTTLKVGTTDYSTATAAGMTDVVVVMFDTAGAVKWVNFFTGTGAEKVTALAADPSGDVLLLAQVASPNLYDLKTGANLVKPGAAGTSVPYLARVAAADGKVAWSKFLGTGGATPYALAASADGSSLAVAGTITSSVDFGIGPLAPAGVGDAFVVVLSATTRAASWQKQIGGTATSGSEDARGVAFDAFNQVAVVGYNRSSDTTVSGTAVTSPPQQVNTGWASFAVKLGTTGNVLWTKGFSSQNVDDAIGLESVGFTAKGELRAGAGLQGTAALDGTASTVTATGGYQMVLWGWAP